MWPLLELTKFSPARIANTSSSAHTWTNGLDFDDLDWRERRFNPRHAYGDSKIATIYFTFGLVDRIVRSGLDASFTVTAVHPQYAAPNITGDNSILWLIQWLFGGTAYDGMLCTLRAGVDVDLPNGSYLVPTRTNSYGPPIISMPSELARSFEVCEKLWAVTEERTGESFQSVLVTAKGGVSS